MKKAREVLKESGLGWFDDEKQDEIFNRIKSEILWYSSDPFYTSNFTGVERIKWARKIIYGGLGRVIIKNPEKFVECFGIRNSDMLGIGIYKGQKIAPSITETGAYEVEMTSEIEMEKLKRDEKEFKQIVENYLPEYFVKKIFNQQEADKNLKLKLVEKANQNVEKIRKNKKLLRWMDEFSLMVIDEYANNQKR